LSDNIIKFPKRPDFEIVFEPDMTARDIEDELDASHASLVCYINGLHVTADIGFEALMHACLLAAANCGIEAGLTSEEFLSVLNSIEIEDAK